MPKRKPSENRKTNRPPVVTTRAELRGAVERLRQAGKKIGIVPTMGSLHAGHLSLVEACCRECDISVVTVFVNPTQFGPDEDYQAYPRSLEADLSALAAHSVDLVFAPNAEEMYASAETTRIDVCGVSQPLEGQHRPGHFVGVATIVAKLLNLVGPQVAYFGQKDYQQSLVVRRMVEDLAMPVEIRVCPIVRDADGLALSSRNAKLTRADRQQAGVLSRCLVAAKEAIAAGERSPASVLEKMRSAAATAPEVQFQYMALVDPETLAEVPSIEGPTLAALAALVGSTRLIDNCFLDPADRSTEL